MRQQLRDVYQRLLRRYGPQHWWPGDSWFEVMVGAVLTQAAAWTNVEMAIASLKAAGALSPEAIRAIDEKELARLVYSSGYYNAKARKLKALAQFIGRRYDDDVEAMRDSGYGDPEGGAARRTRNRRGDRRRHPALCPWQARLHHRQLYEAPLLQAPAGARASPVLQLPVDLHGLPACGPRPVQRVPRPHRAPRREGLPEAAPMRGLLPLGGVPHGIGGYGSIVSFPKRVGEEAAAQRAARYSVSVRGESRTRMLLALMIR